MKSARAAKVENSDRSSLEKKPLAIVTPILDFLTKCAEILPVRSGS